jgi:HSP20 family molecular chaperone IbpA
MKNLDPLATMWMDACDMLSRTERLRRQVFGLCDSAERYACWEPPVDVFESNSELQVVVLLPGVAADNIETSLEKEWLSIRGESPSPLPPRAKIHRLEIPYGSFEKRLRLPFRNYAIKNSEYRDGCLTIHLTLSR